MAIICNILRNLHPVFHCKCTILYFCQQFTRISIALHLHQNLLFSLFLDVAILTGVRWHLVVLIRISLMISEFDYFFHLLFVPLYIFLKKYLFKSFIFFNMVVQLLLSFRSSLYILNINSLLDTRFTNNFSYSLGCLLPC